MVTFPITFDLQLLKKIIKQPNTIFQSYPLKLTLFALQHY